MSFPDLHSLSVGLPTIPPPTNASFAPPSAPHSLGNDNRPTPVPAEKLDTRHPRSVIRNSLAGGNFGFKGHAQHNLKAHGKYLLATPLGRDFALVTSVGVVFKVHATMLLGGSKKLQDSMYPGDIPSTTPAASVALPANFHPVLVDRVVEFIYTGTYADKESAELRLIQNATSFPGDLEAESFARPDLVGAEFHMHMCAVAEELEFPSLYALAHNKMVDSVVVQLVSPLRLAELVDGAFAPRDSGLRVCRDKERWVQKLLVTAVLVQESRFWGKPQKKEFARALVEDRYNVFWDMHDEIRADCVDLLERASRIKSKTAFAGASEAGVQKRTVAKKVLLEKRSAALVRGLERMGLGEDTEL